MNSDDYTQQKWKVTTLLPHNWYVTIIQRNCEEWRLYYPIMDTDDYTPQLWKEITIFPNDNSENYTPQLWRETTILSNAE